VAVLYTQNCPEKTAQDSSSLLSVILMGGRNQIELCLQPSRSLIQWLFPESIQHALSQGGFFMNLHHGSFLCKGLQRRIFEPAEALPNWRKKCMSGRTRMRIKE